MLEVRLTTGQCYGDDLQMHVVVVLLQSRRLLKLLVMICRWSKKELGNTEWKGRHNSAIHELLDQHQLTVAACVCNLQSRHWWRHCGE